jgi:hypothetical protein
MQERRKGTTADGGKQNKWVEKREQYKPNIHLHCTTTLHNVISTLWSNHSF